MSWESTGTVTVTNNSNTVTGVGTLFASASRLGDAFIAPDGGLYEIDNVVSNTVISITPAYKGTTASNVSYKIAPIRGYQKLAADRLFQILATIDAAISVAGQIPAWVTDANTPIPVSRGGTGAKTAEASRTSLGLGNSATRNVGAVAGTVAAGDDTRFLALAGKFDKSEITGVIGTSITKVLSQKGVSDHYVPKVAVGGDGTVGTGEVLRREAYGLGVQAQVANGTPTQFGFSPGLGGNYIALNLDGSYGSLISLSENSAYIASNKAGVAWSAQLYHDKNLLNIGTTAATARTALALGNTATHNYGTAVNTVCMGNDSRVTGAAQLADMTTKLSLKADKSTQVVASTGLNGGGSLSGNVTLSVKYGTTSGSAVEGNDSRLVNAVSTSTYTAGLNTKFDKTDIVHGPGTSTTKAMSQDSSTSTFVPKIHTEGDGTVARFGVSSGPAKLLREGAYGIGELGPNFTMATGLGWNSFFDANMVVSNSFDAPYASALLMGRDSAVLASADASGFVLTQLLTSTNQLALGTTPTSARSALELPSVGEGWIDLRPYLAPGFYWNTLRDGRNSIPRGRVLPCGRIELQGAINHNETSGPLVNGVVLNLPEALRPKYTSGHVVFGDSATPLAFYSVHLLVAGEVEYAPPSVHGDISAVFSTGTPQTDVTEAVIALNGIIMYKE